MAGIYVYSDDPTLTAELVGFARAAGRDAHAIAIGSDAGELLMNCGATALSVLQGSSPLPENYARPIAALLREQDAELFLVGATVRGRDLAARVAGYLDCGMASDVSSLEVSEGKMTAERLTYGGAVVQREVIEGFGVATVPAGRFAAAEGTPTVETLEVEPDARVSVVETTPLVRHGRNLTEEERIVAVGMGLDRVEDLDLVRTLTEALDAGIGCSRGIAEERGWLGEDQYVGISGLTVKPKLYLALGLSGQVQHVVGIRETKIIAAINRDEKAPIFRVCDYGIVGDLYEAIPLLVKALAR